MVGLSLHKQTRPVVPDGIRKDALSAGQRWHVATLDMGLRLSETVDLGDLADAKWVGGAPEVQYDSLHWSCVAYYLWRSPTTGVQKVISSAIYL